MADPARRERARLDLLYDLETYYPETTGLSPFGEDQRRAIKRIELAILEGGLYAQAMPRGFCKTTILVRAIIWAAKYGHRRYGILYGATNSDSKKLIDQVHHELMDNDLLYADFPEICHAVRASEGNAMAANHQRHNGKYTGLVWTSDKVILPEIEGSVSAGGIIETRSMSGGGRGATHTRTDGTVQRPDIIAIDDPQTDTSARSPSQVAHMLDLLQKNILKLAGHKTELAVVANMTVIQPDDFADSLMDRKRFPAWQSERIPMVKAWATAHESFWLTRYAAVRNTFDMDDTDAQKKARIAANRLYAENRELADAGAVVSWEHCYTVNKRRPDLSELSAIQHAYNKLIDEGADAFMSEYQNSPVRAQSSETGALTSAIVRAKANGVPRGTVPTQCSRLTAFIDVQGEALYWLILATGDGFTGHVVDYGSFPDQNARYFTNKDIKITLSDTFKGAGFEGRIYAGLKSLSETLYSRLWKRQDGTVLRLERCLVDSGWGESTEIVRQFCRQSPHAAAIFPSKGFGVTASGSALGDKKPAAGEQVGHHWRINAVRSQRQVLIDTNQWKSFIVARLITATGDAGGLTLFGEENDHVMFADHVCAEYPVRVKAEKSGREVDEWKLKVGQDNHWLDCLVGAFVAASTLGATLQGMREQPRKRQRMDLSAMAQHARG